MRIPAFTTFFLTLLASCVPLQYFYALPPNAHLSQSAIVSRAREALQMGNAARAVSLLEGFVQSHPSDFQARVTLGQAYQMAGQPQNAEHEFREALRVRPDDPAVILALGSLYCQIGEFKKAIPLLQEAAASGKYPAAYFELSIAAARIHRFREAAKALRHIRPPEGLEQRIDYQRLKASIDAGTGNMKRAAKDMEQALRLAPDNTDLIVSTAVVEEQAKNPARTIQLLQPLLMSHPSPLAGLWLLRAQIALRQNPQATVRALDAIQMPRQGELPWHVELGRALTEGGLHEQAVSQFQAAARIAPNDRTVFFDLAVEQYRAGELDSALATTARAVALGDSAEIEDLRGDIEESRSDSLAAIHCYQKAVALAPSEKRYRLALGFELVKHHSYEPALVVFQQAVRLFPDSVRMQVALGVTDYFLERYDKAGQELIRAVKLERKSDIALNYLGTTQLNQPIGVDSSAMAAICHRADSDSRDRLAITYCGALKLRKAYMVGDKSQAREILQLLWKAAKLSPEDPVAICELGTGLQWAGQWAAARTQMETCVKLRPNSSDDHYRLGQIDEHLGLSQLAQQQFRLQTAEYQKMRESITHHEALVKKFLFDIRCDSNLPSGCKAGNNLQIPGANSGAKLQDPM